MELKKIIAQNIAELRRTAGMTQLELAEKLNYSDKAVSKWESGASVPDIGVILEIAQIFGVTVDYIVSEDHKLPVKAMMRETVMHRKHLLISLMAVAGVWLCATAVFVALQLCGIKEMLWLAFIWAVPVSAIVAIVFNSLWGKGIVNFVFVSILMWSILASVYFTFIQYNVWIIFVLGIPGQLLIGLWSGIFRKKNR